MMPTQAADHFSTALQPLLAQAMSQSANPMLIADEAGKIVWVNHAFCSQSGYVADEIIGHTPRLFKSGHQEPQFYARLWQTILAGDVWQGEVTDQRKDGSHYRAEETITPLRDEDGKVRHFIALQLDITERARVHERDRYLAYHDELTGLPNRTMLREIEQKAMSHALRSRQLLAMLFLDLDGFKSINDTMGHLIGDQLLAAVAERLRGSVRQYDTVARVGGDEFAILMSDIDTPDTVERTAQHLLDALARPFLVRGRRIAIRTSIGIAFFPSDSHSSATLLDHADQAMYQAKLQGGQRYQHYQHYQQGFAPRSAPATGAHAINAQALPQGEGDVLR